MIEEVVIVVNEVVFKEDEEDKEVEEEREKKTPTSMKTCYVPDAVENVFCILSPHISLVSQLPSIMLISQTGKLRFRDVNLCKER